MDARTLITTSPEETKQFGRDLARELRAGDVLFLTGDLGAGKTTLVQGIAEGLGATTPATSPSFVIVNEYLFPNGVLRHIDLYRLPDPSVDIDRIGLPELLNDPQAITLVEWADRLPTDVVDAIGQVMKITMVHGEQEGERRIVVSA